MKQRPAAGAAFVIVALAFAGCAGAESTNTTTTSASTTAVTAASSTTAATTTTATVSATTIAGLIAAPAFVVPYQFVSSEVTLVKSMGIADGWIDYRAGSDQFLLFTTGGPGSVDAWVEFLTTDSRLIASEPEQSEIGGQPATTLDVRLSGPSFSLFTYAPAPGENAAWGIEEGAANRIHLVELDDVTVAIIAEAPEDKFEEFTAAIDAALATLEWNPVG